MLHHLRSTFLAVQPYSPYSSESQQTVIKTKKHAGPQGPGMLYLSQHVKRLIRFYFTNCPRVTPSWLVAFSFFHTWVPLISPRRARL